MDLETLCQNAEASHPMKHILSLPILLTMTSFGLAESFFYSYSNVFAPTADTYVVSQLNVQKLDEGVVGFYAPIAVNTPALLTYQFSFSNAITRANLFAHMSSYNFGEGIQGYGSLWASKDGASWQLLLDAPTPTGIDAGYFYNTDLPIEVLGDTNIFIQARMQASGSEVMSQFSRKDYAVPGDVFAISVETVPEPSTYALLLFSGAASLWALRRRKS